MAVKTMQGNTIPTSSSLCILFLDPVKKKNSHFPDHARPYPLLENFISPKYFSLQQVGSAIKNNTFHMHQETHIKIMKQTQKR